MTGRPGDWARRLRVECAARCDVTIVERGGLDVDGSLVRIEDLLSFVSGGRA